MKETPLEAIVVGTALITSIIMGAYATAFHTTEYVGRKLYGI